MVNTEKGKRYGTIYIPYHYEGERMAAILTYLFIVPISIEKRQYNWEITGTSSYFDGLDDMESVPFYDLRTTWKSKNRVHTIDIIRSG